MKRIEKPIIETLINTAALALTSYAVIEITQKNNYVGAIALIIGMSLEFMKYWGRKKALW